MKLFDGIKDFFFAADDDDFEFEFLDLDNDNDGKRR